MRTKLLVLNVLLVILAILFLGCKGKKDLGNEEKTRVDKSPKAVAQAIEVQAPQEPKAGNEPGAMRVYADTIARFFNLVANPGGDYDVYSGEAAVWDSIEDKSRMQALQSVGYAVLDVSGDGVEELLIGAIDKSEGGSHVGSEVYALFTIVDGEVRLSFAGKALNRYYHMGDRRFFNSGTEGGASSHFGSFTLARDGKGLECNDFYFTGEAEGDPVRTEYFHNTECAFDKENAKKLESLEEFDKIEAKLSKQVQEIELTPFAEYEATKARLDAGDNAGNDVDDDADDDGDDELQAQYLKDFKGDLGEHESFDADNDEYQVKILFSSKTELKNFKVHGLELRYDTHGNRSFKTEDLYSLGSLLPTRPLVLGMTFFGDTAAYAVSYVNRRGETEVYSIELSGFDGSIELIRLK
ncbi:MAG: hypothetical protein WC966_01585 [Bradymonadales bacterium]|jgi:hypothetical protein